MKKNISLAVIALLAAPVIAAQSGGSSGSGAGSGTSGQGSGQSGSRGTGQGSGQTGSGQTGGQTGRTGQPGGTGQPGTTGAGSQTGRAGELQNTMAGQLGLHRSEDVVGLSIKNGQGANIGKIEDVIVYGTGEAPYAVVELSEPGMNDKLVVVPLSMLRSGAATGDVVGDRTPRTERDNHVTLSMDAERLRSAPTMTKNDWSKIGQAATYDEVDKFYRNDPGMQGRPIDASARGANFTAMRASQLKGRNLESATGEKIGDIRDVVVDTSSGRINYVAVSVGGFLGIGDRTVAIPWESITIQPNKDGKDEKFIVRATKEQLSNAPEFKAGKENWAQMSDAAYVNSVYSHYSARPYWNDASRGTDSMGGSRSGGQSGSGQSGDTRGGNTGGNTTGGQKKTGGG